DVKSKESAWSAGAREAKPSIQAEAPADQSLAAATEAARRILSFAASTKPASVRILSFRASTIVILTSEGYLAALAPRAGERCTMLFLRKRLSCLFTVSRFAPTICAISQSFHGSLLNLLRPDPPGVGTRWAGTCHNARVTARRTESRLYSKAVAAPIRTCWPASMNGWGPLKSRLQIKIVLIKTKIVLIRWLRGGAFPDGTPHRSVVSHNDNAFLRAFSFCAGARPPG